MQPLQASQTANTQQPQTPQPCCPVCGGQVFDLRGMLRCTRCYFTLCESCGGSEPLVMVDE